jgi:hypothetical protein
MKHSTLRVELDIGGGGGGASSKTVGPSQVTPRVVHACLLPSTTAPEGLL